MQLFGVQVFLAVWKTGSITAAAAELGYSRAAVSQQLTDLEHYLGYPLFD